MLFFKMAYSQLDTLKGKVIGVNSKQPLMFASITVYNQLDSLITETETDLDGNFEVIGLAKGNYNISIFYIGYSNQIEAISIPTDKQIVIKLIEGISSSRTTKTITIPIIHLNRMTRGRIYTAEDLEKSPVKW